MTFLETLQAHRGGLIQLKAELYWYGGRGWDGNPGRVCLLLDAARTAAARLTTARTAAATGTASALLLIDGSPKWVWVDEEDVELL